MPAYPSYAGQVDLEGVHFDLRCHDVDVVSKGHLFNFGFIGR